MIIPPFLLGRTPDHTRAIRFAQGDDPDAEQAREIALTVLVIVCHGGRFVALEFKAPDGEQSTEQRIWESWVERAGGAYAVVRTVGEAVEAVRRRGR